MPVLLGSNPTQTRSAVQVDHIRSQNRVFVMPKEQVTRGEAWYFSQKEGPVPYGTAGSLPKHFCSHDLWPISNCTTMAQLNSILTQRLSVVKSLDVSSKSGSTPVRTRSPQLSSGSVCNMIVTAIIEVVIEGTNGSMNAGAMRWAWSRFSFSKRRKQ